MILVLALCASVVLHLPTARPAAEWVYPLAGPPEVVRGFAPPPNLQPWRRGNRGVDLAAPVGAPVRAAGAGVVSFAGPLADRGVVVIVHGALRTTYEPVEASVSEGQIVDAGEQIGHLQAGTAHCPPRSCLHWGLRRGDRYLDPMLLLGTVRLLPQLPAGADAPLPGARPRNASRTRVRQGLEVLAPHGPRVPIERNPADRGSSIVDPVDGSESAAARDAGGRAGAFEPPPSPPAPLVVGCLSLGATLSSVALLAGTRRRSAWRT
jgi:murein DD-endopeptidase MepM/ murein hydrolase activator NlpD